MSELPHNGSETSRAAAESMVPHATTIRDKILAYIRSQGVKGSTIDETAVALGIRTATVCARYSELKGGTYGDGETAKNHTASIVPNGMKRQTSSGRSAVCWIAVD